MERLRAVAVSTPFVGAVVALASWKPYFAAPAPGVDPSWQAGLYMAADRGLDFGRELIYTWGPLGFLGQAGAVPYEVGLALVAALFQAALHLALCIALVWALRPRFGLALAALLALAAALLPLDSVLVLGLALCLAALAGDQPAAARVLPLGGGALAAVECLVTPRWGPPLLICTAATLLVLPERRRRMALFAAAAVGTFLLLWLALGNSLWGLDDLAGRWAQVVGGYAQASGIEIDTPAWQHPAAALAAAALLAGTYLAVRGLARGRAAVALGTVALVMFASFKEGFVAPDSFHVAGYFATAAGVAVALPWRGSQRLPALALALALLALGYVALPTGTERFLLPGERVRAVSSYARTLASPSRLERLRDDGRRAMRAYYRVDPGTLRLLHGHSVHVDPWEAGVAWAYDLDWHPLPVFQDYVAYTADLDSWNADTLSGPRAPQRILRENSAVVDPAFATYDGRLPSWDPPGAALAMLCHYRGIRTTRRWQVLARTRDRCGEPVPIGALETRYGARVEVPPPAGAGEAVFARVHGAGVGGLERLRTLLYRAEARYVTIEGDPAPHRLVPGTAGQGLLLSAPGRADFPSPFALAPGARGLVFRKGDATDSLAIDFFSMRVRAPAAVAGLPPRAGSG